MQKQTTGFSLLEVLIVLTIIIVTASFTFSFIPSQSLLPSYLITAIQFAKQEARTRHAPIAICPTRTQTNCDGNWDEGLLIFTDQANDGRVHSPQQILSVMKSQPTKGVLHSQFFPAYRRYLRFQPTQLYGSDNGTFWYCKPHQTKPDWVLVLNQMGQYRVMYPARKKEAGDEDVRC